MIQDIERTDARLLKAWAMKRDQQALAALIERYTLVMGVCRRQCRNLSDAEDAFQVTFMILARSSQAIRNSVALPAWLHATAYRVASRTRLQRRWEGPEALECISSGEDTFADVSRRHELRVLDEELEQMPDHLRAPLILHYLDGQGVADVAQHLGTTAGSVRGRLQRGKAELRRRLIVRGVSLSAALVVMKSMNVASAASMQSSVAFSALTNAPITYLPRPIPDPLTLNTPSTSSYLVSSSSGAIMRSVLGATILSLGITLWGSLESGLPDGSPSARMAAVPIDQAQNREMRIADLGASLDNLFQIANETSNTVQENKDAGAIPADPDSGDSATNPAENTRPNGDASNPPNEPSNPDQFVGGQFGGGAGGMGGMGGGMGGMGGGMGGMGGGGFGGSSLSSPLEEPVKSDYEMQLEEMLLETLVDKPIAAENVAQFADSVAKQIGVPVVIRVPKGIEGVTLDNPIQIPSGDMPLGVALKNALRASKLKAIVRDDAVMIVPDTVALAQEGIGTSRYVNVDDAFVKRMEQALSKTTSQEWSVVPLEDAMRILQTEIGIPVVIDTRALEDLGLTRDVPMNVHLSDASYESFLKLAFGEHDLQLRPENGFIRVTTQDNAEDTNEMLIRIYWLDGTGFRTANSAMEVIQNIVHPDIWDLVGGPASMRELRNSASGRIALVVSTTYAIHRDIEKLLDELRNGEFDPYLTPASEPSIGMGGYGGGMGGMGGGGMGGSGGLGGGGMGGMF